MIWGYPYDFGKPLDVENPHLKIDPCTLWLFDIAMENGPFIDGLPIKNCDFPWLC